MSSQTDLDQGGTFRQWKRVYMGPSVGWVWAPDQNELDVLTAGTTTITNSTNLVRVNSAGLVTIQLYLTNLPAVPAIARPGDYVFNPVNIIDVGGLASDVNPITILPAAGKNIDGLTQIQILNAFGAFLLFPKANGGWTIAP